MIERYRAILSAIQGTRAKLIAVSKGQPLELIEALHAEGHRDFGENYAQELLEKVRALEPRGITDIRWHFLGHLQTNKVRQILPHIWMIHSVDSQRLAGEISRRAETLGVRARILVEVNVEGEASKSGVVTVGPEGSEGLSELLSGVSALPGVELRGLMCIPSREGGLSGDAFRLLRALRDRHRARLGPGELSMGMSEDYPVAAREGSDWVRVGTALFGPRKQ